MIRFKNRVNTLGKEDENKSRDWAGCVSLISREGKALSWAGTHAYNIAATPKNDED
jgi:hypothetical protein